jgi:N-acetylmuramoyl-L-alanine amidase
MITATLRNREEAAIEHYRWKKIALTPTLPALRLQAKTDHYNRSITAKKRINLHYTAGILPGDIPELTRPAKYIQGKRYGPKSVPYLIARIGTILELHDPRFWAYHMGATAIGGNAAMSQAGIGIELSNVGWLTEKQGLMYTYFGQPYCSVEQEDLYVRTPEYRGHTIWATFSDEQYTSLRALLLHLSRQFAIPLRTLPEARRGLVDWAATRERGVFSHVNYRQDKYDTGAALDWSKII